jgi:hypothetical protein
MSTSSPSQSYSSGSNYNLGSSSTNGATWNQGNNWNTGSNISPSNIVINISPSSSDQSYSSSGVQSASNLQSAATYQPSTTYQSTTTNQPSTTYQSSTTYQPSTTYQSTTTYQPSTTDQTYANVQSYPIDQTIPIDTSSSQYYATSGDQSSSSDQSSPNDQSYVSDQYLNYQLPTAATTTSTDTSATYQIVGATADNYGCAQWTNGVCTQCSYRYIAMSQTCQPVNPLCQTWDNTGKCLTCYTGYEICAEGCIPAPATPGPSYNQPLCNTFDSTGKCTKCATGAYFNNGVCVQANANCQTFSQTNGWCLSCYAGYSLQVGQCVLIPLCPANNAPSDLLCASWSGNTCLKCSVNAYFNNGVCTQVNPLCMTFDSSNGNCLSCYNGYTLYNGYCAINQVSPNNTAPSDLLCAQWSNGICMMCSTGAFFRNCVCVQADTQCKTFDQTYGNCLSCYSGYYLDSGQCLQSYNAPNNTQPSDLLCAKWSNGICIQCSQTAYFRNGICTQSDALCKTFSQTNGNCLSCYSGYNLSYGTCVKAATGPTDLLCAKFSNGVCTQCAQTAYFQNGVCVQANVLCMTFNTINGYCLSCYNGYSLSSGNCYRSSNNNSQPSDLLCAIWNGNVCQQCAKTAYFYNGVCTQSNPLCKTFNTNNGWCLSCYSGYNLQNGQCIIATNAPTDLLCAQWNNGICTQCATTAYFRNGVCTQSNPQCRTFDQSNGLCLSCYNGYILSSGNCNVAPNTSPTGPQLPSNFSIYCKTYVAGICQ